MLFCPSFTQSERFLHTDQLITGLQVVVMADFIRMLSGNVIVNGFKSDAVIWWAAIFRTQVPRSGMFRFSTIKWYVAVFSNLKFTRRQSMQCKHLVQTLAHTHAQFDVRCM